MLAPKHAFIVCDGWKTFGIGRAICQNHWGRTKITQLAYCTFVLNPYKQNEDNDAYNKAENTD
jgi:hypothetical protein